MQWTIDLASPERLQDQIATCVRRGLRSGELVEGEQMPPAAELGEALSVNRNTVLAAYRALRDEGVLEFRRGRGARVATVAPVDPAVVTGAAELIDLAHRHGVDRDALIRILKELP